MFMAYTSYTSRADAGCSFFSNPNRSLHYEAALEHREVWCGAIVNRPFSSCPQSLFQSESKYETFVMIISSIFNVNEN